LWITDSYLALFVVVAIVVGVRVAGDRTGSPPTTNALADDNGGQIKIMEIIVRDDHVAVDAAVAAATAA